VGLPGKVFRGENMMQLDGKTIYSISDVVKELGYSKGTLVNYISGGIVDSIRMDDGEWFITEAGMVALRRRKKIPADPPTPDHIVEVNKKVSPKPENIPEGTLYLRTDEDQAKYEVIREAARIMRINVGDMSMTAIRYYVDHFLSEKLDELKALDEKKKQIIAGVTS